MVSRKRKKGKDRKAKKMQSQELYLNISQRLWQGWAAGEREFLDMATDIECDHGCGCNYTITPKQFAEHQPLVIPELVDNFMTAYFYNKDFGGFNNQLESIVLFQSNRDVFISDRYRNMVANILTRVGINMMLRGDHEDLSHAVGIARTIVVLEHYDGGDDLAKTIKDRLVASKIRDLLWEGSSSSSSIARDLLKFFRKRIDCSCLRRMHLDARKTATKRGTCDHCYEEQERALLMVCGRCRVCQYCSRECQIAGWDDHKSICDLYVRAQDSGNGTEDETRTNTENVH